MNLRPILRLCPVLIAMLVLPACSVSQGNRPNQSGRQESMTQKDINAVLRDHDTELLAIPRVIGVYVGLLPDGKTPCLKVMVTEKTDDLERRIPKSIEGYPVVIEETGIIRPLRK